MSFKEFSYIVGDFYSTSYNRTLITVIVFTKNNFTIIYAFITNCHIQLHICMIITDEIRILVIHKCNYTLFQISLSSELVRVCACEVMVGADSSIFVKSRDIPMRIGSELYYRIVFTIHCVRT